MNTNFDENLLTIENLVRLPWVGSNYTEMASADNNLLILGESHYHDESEKSILNHSRPTFTREVVKELAIERMYWGTRIFPNIHKTLFENDTFDSGIFWNCVSFYNFIQRVMPTRKGRPKKEDYLTGWKVFFSVIDVIKPATVLFVGTTSANYLHEAVLNTGYSLEAFAWEEKIGNAYAKSGIIKSTDGRLTKLIFIRHTSQMYSAPKWNVYLKKVMPETLSELKLRVL